MAQTYFAVTIPGLEAQLQAELRALGAKKCEAYRGGVTFRATRAKSYSILRRIRQANRLYWRLDEFRARDARELHRKSTRLDWSKWLPDGVVLKIDAHMLASSFGGTGQIADTVQYAIMDSMRLNGKLCTFDDSDPKAMRIIARVVDSRCELSLDLAFHPLYQRGWRSNTGRAPLRETIANALLAATGWTPERPLIDPMCGAGTFIIEAARQAAEMSPRKGVRYAAESLVNFDSAAWADAAPAASASKGVLLQGFDKEAKSVARARENAKGADVAARVNFSTQDVAVLAPVGDIPGVVICNPPYGQRIERGEGEKAADKILLDRFAMKEFAGWRLGFVAPSDFSFSHDVLRIEEVLRFKNGGFPVRFWLATHPRE